MSRRKEGDGVIRDCAHTRTRHEHGTVQAYNGDACRCARCRKAARDAKRAAYRRKAYGQDTKPVLVDATEARQRVAELMEAGFSLKAIAAAAGAPLPRVSRLMYGLPSRGKGPTEALPATHVAALIAANPSWLDLPATALVRTTGTTRRIQALACLGWPVSHIGEEAGIAPGHTHHVFLAKTISAGTAQHIARIYQRLAMSPAPDSTTAKRVRAIASRHGWAPPMAWDDETIDDPAAVPNLGEKVPRRLAVAEDVEHLLSQGVDPWRLHERTGHTDAGALRTMLQRTDRHDLANLITTNPWEHQDYLDRRRAA